MKKSILCLSLLMFVFFSCKNVNSETNIEGDDSFNNNYKAPTQISLGFLTLDPSKSISEQITSTNFIYEILYDFDLKDETITIPSNCKLKFSGGIIRNGTINFTGTVLDGYVQFKNCHYKGTLENSIVRMEWFDISYNKTADVIIHNSTKKVNTHNGTMLNEILNISKNRTVFFDKIYFVYDTITISYPITLKGYDYNEGIYSVMNQNMEYGIYHVDFGSYNSAIIAESGSIINMYGITIGRNIQQYISGNLWDKEYLNGKDLKTPIDVCGIDLKSGGKINEIHDSTFYGFTYGIRATGNAKVTYIKNTYFSSNRFGFWGDGIANPTFRGCRFNTNMLNFPFYKRNLIDRVKRFENDVEQIHPLTYEDGSQIRRIGGGIYLRNCNNCSIDHCRFEFNFIHIIIDEGGSQNIVKNCIFDTGTISQIMVFNDNDQSNSENFVRLKDLQIYGNTFARGARCDILGEKSKPGFGILYIVEGDNRGSSISFENNIISDDMEVDTSIDVAYEDSIFLIHNTSDSINPGKLTVRGNSFLSAKAKTIFSVTDSSSGSYQVSYNNNDQGSFSDTNTEQLFTTGNTSVLNFF